MRRLAKGLSALTYRRSAAGTGHIDARIVATRDPLSRVEGSSAPSIRPSLLATAGLAIALLLPAQGAQAGKVPGFGTIGSLGNGAGQLGSTPRGLAVNHTGAGGVSAGDVYASDSTNNRVVQFGANGDFVRAFGVDVVAPGGAESSSEIQRISVNASGGTFRLTFGGVGTNTTGAVGIGDLEGGSTVVENLATTTGVFVAGETIGGDGIPAGTTIASVGVNELTLSQPASQTASGIALTADLSFDSPAPVVESALNALTPIATGGGSVSVVGGPGGPSGGTPYVITFNGGPLKGTDVPQVTASSGFLPLSGGVGAGANEIKVSTTNAGATGYEVCSSGSPCKAGLSSSAAGGLNAGQGIAIDQSTGDVFVVSNGGRRINIYTAKGEFQGAFGWKVDASEPAETLQFCTFATGCAVGSLGAGAGQFGALTAGIRASTPAIDPTNGHIFVPEIGNRRISEFSLERNAEDEVVGVNFVRAFGGDVAPTISEIQVVTLVGATGGTFALALDSEVTGAAGVGDIEAGSNEITNLEVTSGEFVRGEEVAGPGLPPGTTITAVTPDTLTLSEEATVSTAGAEFSAALPYDADPLAVRAALQALDAVGSGNVKVSGVAGGPFTVEFAGDLAGQDVGDMVGDSSTLTGPGAAVNVVTIQNGTGGSGTGFEACTVVSGCQIGKEGTGKDGIFPLNGPTGLAIDSTGAVYIASDNTQPSCSDSCGVYKFTPESGSPQEFAPDHLSVADGSIARAGVTVKGLVVNPVNDHVLVMKMVSDTQLKIFEFTRSGAFVESYPPGVSGLDVNVNPSQSNGPSGFAVGVNGQLYLAQTGAGKALILDSPPAPEATIESATSIGATSATLSGVAAPSAPGIEGGFPTIAFFEYSPDGVLWEKTEPIELGDGSGAGNPNTCPAGNPPSCNIAQKIQNLEPGQGYVARLVVTNGTSTISTSTSFKTRDTPPSISKMRAHASSTSATVSGELNPRNKPTTYHFEWGRDASYGHRIPTDFEAVAGAGSGPVSVSAKLSDLEPNTTYHYRIVASNNSGTTIGPDATFTTLNVAGLPANRAIELVSISEKWPAGSVQSYGPGGGVTFQAADDGDSAVYPILNGIEGSPAGGAPEYLARRGAGGWTSTAISPRSSVVIPQNENIEPSQIRYLDLGESGCAVVESYSPLTDDTPAATVENGVPNLYMWRAEDSSYTLITNRLPTDPTHVGKFSVAGASAGCEKVFFRTRQGATAPPPGHRYFQGGSPLYEWSDGVIRDAGLIPLGATLVPGTGNVGASAAESARSVSASGRLFFDANNGAGVPAVFVRKGPADIVEASASKTATPLRGARYETATADGSTVFFLANYGLTADGSLSDVQTTSCADTSQKAQIRNDACALYAYDVDSGDLVEISSDSNPMDKRGPVALGVLDVSADGSTVYFAARGQLVPGRGKTYIQNTQGAGGASVYRWHEGELEYIAPLVGGDFDEVAAKRGVPLIHAPWSAVAQTTADGKYLLFVSRANVEDGNATGLPMAYLYNAVDGGVHCVSCPSDGVPERGWPGPVELVAALHQDVASYSNRRPRSLSEDGRVIFTSFEALVPTATQGKRNIYEWYGGQISLLASGNVEFKDMTPSGRDVFITARERLVPEDHDSAADLYDFRVDGAVPAGSTPMPACRPEFDECQGQRSPQPQPPAIATEVSGGQGNVIPRSARRRCGKGKVLRGKRCVNQRKRRSKSKKNRGKRKLASAPHGWSATSRIGGGK